MYSLSILLKSSCKQLFKFNLWEGSSFSEQKKRSQAYGNQKANEKIKQYRELRIDFEHKGIFLIIGCVDEIRVTERNLLFVEHKNTEGEEPSWLETNGIIQAAALEALYFYRRNKVLRSASFIPKDEKQVLTVEKSVKSFLWINDRKYSIKIKPGGHKEIIRFLLTKIRASRNWDTAARFDEKYKHKEWDYFKQFVTYKAVKRVR